METARFEAELLDAIYAEVERSFASLDDPAHGWEHVNRVYTLALHIAEREQAKRMVVGAAALLHDIGRTASHGSAQHHADLSVTLAREMLAAHRLSTDVLEEILHAIAAHSYSRGIEPRTLEARVVRDADRLDALGAVGILRWAVSATLRRTPRTRIYHPGDPFARRHELDDGAYMLDHFYTKLLKLGDSMSTETGRELAGQRTAFMRGYLEELQKELLA
jgi:uncharacterized protein